MSPLLNRRSRTILRKALEKRVRVHLLPDNWNLRTWTFRVMRPLEGQEIRFVAGYCEEGRHMCMALHPIMAFSFSGLRRLTSKVRQIASLVMPRMT